MKVQPAVRKETAKVGLGTAILSVLMLGVFALLGRLDLTVVLGTLLGAGAAMLNFFLMALSVQQAAEDMHGVHVPPEPEGEEGEDAPSAEPVPEIQRAKRRMSLSYTGRMLMLAVVAILALSLDCFHPIPAALALLFPRIAISVEGFLQSHKKEA